MRFSAVVVIAAVVACLPKAEAQAPTGSIVRFGMENATLYVYDCPFVDVGTNPNNLGHPLTTVGIYSGLGIADIVSVNGNPAKGTAYQQFSPAFLARLCPFLWHVLRAIAQWLFGATGLFTRIYASVTLRVQRYISRLAVVVL